MKRNALLLVALLLIVAGSAWSAEPYKFTLWLPLNPGTPANNNIPLLVDVENRFNVRINRTGEEYTAAKEKTNILLASGDIPDVFVIEPVDLAAGSSEMFLPLNDLLQKEGKDILAFLKANYPLLLKKVTRDDGTIWGIPWYIVSFRPINAWQIRQDWLDKLGMKKPTTTDELEQTLLAFKNRDPANLGREQVVWANRWGVLNQARTVNLFGAELEHYVVNGKVTWGPFTDNFREMLKWLNKLYKQGLVDPEFPIRSSTDWEAKVAAGQTGFTYANFARIDWFDTVTKVPGANWQPLAPVKAPVGQPLIYTNNGQNMQRVGVLSKKVKNPEAIIRWLNFYFTEEGRMLNMFGKKGEDYTIQNGYPVIAEKYWKTDKDIRYAQQTVGIGGDLNNWVGSPREQLLNRIASSSKETAQALTDQEKYIPPVESILPPVTYLTAESAKIKQWNATMTPVWEEYWVKFITGDLPITAWDQYKKELGGLGMNDWIQTIQNAYDRLMK